MLPLMPVWAAQVLGSALKTKTALLESVQSMIDEDLSFVSSDTGETLPTVPVRHDEPFSAADKERLSRRFQQASGRPARRKALDPEQALGFHGNAGLESSRPRPMIAHRTIQAGVPGRGGIWQREDTVIQFLPEVLPEDLQNRGETTGIDVQMDPCAASENCEKPPLRQPGQDMSPARGSPHLPGRSDGETGTPHARERDVDAMETWAESICGSLRRRHARLRMLMPWVEWQRVALRRSRNERILQRFAAVAILSLLSSCRKLIREWRVRATCRICLNHTFAVVRSRMLDRNWPLLLGQEVRASFSAWKLQLQQRRREKRGCRLVQRWQHQLRKGITFSVLTEFVHAANRSRRRRADADAHLAKHCRSSRVRVLILLGWHTVVKHRLWEAGVQRMVRKRRKFYVLQQHLVLWSLLVGQRQTRSWQRLESKKKQRSRSRSCLLSALGSWSHNAQVNCIRHGVAGSIAQFANSRMQRVTTRMCYEHWSTVSTGADEARRGWNGMAVGLLLRGARGPLRVGKKGWRMLRLQAAVDGRSQCTRHEPYESLVTDTVEQNVMFGERVLFKQREQLRMLALAFSRWRLAYMQHSMAHVSFRLDALANYHLRELMMKMMRGWRRRVRLEAVIRRRHCARGLLTLRKRLHVWTCLTALNRRQQMICSRVCARHEFRVLRTYLNRWLISRHENLRTARFECIVSRRCSMNEQALKSVCLISWAQIALSYRGESCILSSDTWGVVDSEHNLALAVGRWKLQLKTNQKWKPISQKLLRCFVRFTVSKAFVKWREAHDFCRMELQVQNRYGPCLRFQRVRHAFQKWNNSRICTTVLRRLHARCRYRRRRRDLACFLQEWLKDVQFRRRLKRIYYRFFYRSLHATLRTALATWKDARHRQRRLKLIRTRHDQLALRIALAAWSLRLHLKFIATRRSRRSQIRLQSNCLWMWGLLVVRNQRAKKMIGICLNFHWRRSSAHVFDCFSEWTRIKEKARARVDVFAKLLKQSKHFLKSKAFSAWQLASGGKTLANHRRQQVCAKTLRVGGRKILQSVLFVWKDLAVDTAHITKFRRKHNILLKMQALHAWNHAVRCHHYQTKVAKTVQKRCRRDLLHTLIDAWTRQRKSALISSNVLSRTLNKLIRSYLLRWEHAVVLCKSTKLLSRRVFALQTQKQHVDKLLCFHAWASITRHVKGHSRRAGQILRQRNLRLSSDVIFHWSATRKWKNAQRDTILHFDRRTRVEKMTLLVRRWHMLVVARHDGRKCSRNFMLANKKRRGVIVLLKECMFHWIWVLASARRIQKLVLLATRLAEHKGQRSLKDGFLNWSRIIPKRLESNYFTRLAQWRQRCVLFKVLGVSFQMWFHTVFIVTQQSLADRRQRRCVFMSSFDMQSNLRLLQSILSNWVRHFSSKRVLRLKLQRAQEQWRRYITQSTLVKYFHRLKDEVDFGKRMQKIISSIHGTRCTILLQTVNIWKSAVLIGSVHDQHQKLISITWAVLALREARKLKACVFANWRSVVISAFRRSVAINLMQCLRGGYLKRLVFMVWRSQAYSEHVTIAQMFLGWQRRTRIEKKLLPGQGAIRARRNKNVLFRCWMHCIQDRIAQKRADRRLYKLHSILQRRLMTATECEHLNAWLELTRQTKIVKFRTRRRLQFFQKRHLAAWQAMSFETVCIPRRTFEQKSCYMARNVQRKTMKLCVLAWEEHVMAARTRKFKKSAASQAKSRMNRRLQRQMLTMWGGLCCEHTRLSHLDLYFRQCDNRSLKLESFHFWNEVKTKEQNLMRRVKQESEESDRKLRCDMEMCQRLLLRYKLRLHERRLTTAFVGWLVHCVNIKHLMSVEQVFILADKRRVRNVKWQNLRNWRKNIHDSRRLRAFQEGRKWRKMNSAFESWKHSKFLQIHEVRLLERNLRRKRIATLRIALLRWLQMAILAAPLLKSIVARVRGDRWYQSLMLRTCLSTWHHHVQSCFCMIHTSSRISSTCLGRWKHKVQRQRLARRLNTVMRSIRKKIDSHLTNQTFGSWARTRMRKKRFRKTYGLWMGQTISRAFKHWNNVHFLQRKNDEFMRLKEIHRQNLQQKDDELLQAAQEHQQLVRELKEQHDSDLVALQHEKEEALGLAKERHEQEQQKTEAAITVLKAQHALECQQKDDALVSLEEKSRDEWRDLQAQHAEELKTMEVTRRDVEDKHAAALQKQEDAQQSLKEQHQRLLQEIADRRDFDVRTIGMKRQEEGEEMEKERRNLLQQKEEALYELNIRKEEELLQFKQAQRQLLEDYERDRKSQLVALETDFAEQIKVFDKESKCALQAQKSECDAKLQLQEEELHWLRLQEAAKQRDFEHQISVVECARERQLEEQRCKFQATIHSLQTEVQELTCKVKDQDMLVDVLMEEVKVLQQLQAETAEAVIEGQMMVENGQNVQKGLKVELTRTKAEFEEEVSAVHSLQLSLIMEREESHAMFLARNAHDVGCRVDAVQIKLSNIEEMILLLQAAIGREELIACRNDALRQAKVATELRVVDSRSAQRFRTAAHNLAMLQQALHTQYSAHAILKGWRRCCCIRRRCVRDTTALLKRHDVAAMRLALLGFRRLVSSTHKVKRLFTRKALCTKRWALAALAWHRREMDKLEQCSRQIVQAQQILSAQSAMVHFFTVWSSMVSTFPEKREYTQQVLAELTAASQQSELARQIHSSASVNAAFAQLQSSRELDNIITTLQGENIANELSLPPLIVGPPEETDNVDRISTFGPG